MAWAAEEWAAEAWAAEALAAEALAAEAWAAGAWAAGAWAAEAQAAEAWAAEAWAAGGMGWQGRTGEPSKSCMSVSTIARAPTSDRFACVLKLFSVVHRCQVH